MAFCSFLLCSSVYPPVLYFLIFILFFYILQSFCLDLGHTRAAEMLQQLRACIALSEDAGWVPKTHIRQFTIALSSSSRRDPVPPSHTHTLKQIIKINLYI